MTLRRRGAKTLAMTTKKTKKMISIQTIWPGQYSVLSCGMPPSSAGFSVDVVVVTAPDDAVWDCASCAALVSGTVDATTVGAVAEALNPLSEAADAEMASAEDWIMVYP